MKNIILMRRGPLSKIELAQLQAKFPGERFEFVDAAPDSPEMWLTTCCENGDVTEVLVILPSQAPLPTLAMAEGYKHIAFFERGPMLLTEVDAKFKPL